MLTSEAGPLPCGSGPDQPIGHPMSVSTQSGFRLPFCATTAGSPGVFLVWADGAPPSFFQSLATGVVSDARMTAVASPSPDVGLAPFRLWFPQIVGVGQ